MATPSPWQVALPRRPQHVKKIDVYAYDPYNFSHLTTTSGTNPVIRIPAVGPNAAGAVYPTSARTIVDVIVKVWGTHAPDYGNNSGVPPGPVAYGGATETASTSPQCPPPGHPPCR